MFIIFWLLGIPFMELIMIDSIWMPAETRWSWDPPYYVMIMSVVTIPTFPCYWGMTAMTRRAIAESGDGPPTRVIAEEGDK